MANGELRSIGEGCGIATQLAPYGAVDDCGKGLPRVARGGKEVAEIERMAKGLEKHQERQAQLSILGKDLTRRSGSKCELCEASGVALRPYPVPPEGEVPQVETCVFVCDICREQLEHPKRIDAAHWRCACQSVWSEVPAVQVVAARVLDRLGKTELWAREAREAAYFDEEVELWIGQDSL